ncbi:MAG: transcription antitermination factor NusB [Candidatus Omnitrophica bacterium]|nr:transcription antitermination factor NusB [Candidatus Omnitrophota bacterium]
MLYEIDVTKDPPDQIIKNFWETNQNIDAQVREFAEFLFRGVIDNLSQINLKISSASQNWSIRRMAIVDRNILRLASFELLFCSDIPPKVSINEAVELAKKFSGREAARFVNGILDKIKEYKI